ncbi:uncharacterized protein LOC127447139 [Myxocyprinus asiaticus]|uniref:uncharacterized protein LOC127447139 n=1 Tax=Myxocyprinus asiaticus TaxID=70543 RepID=UPI002222503B|nr:uncharacterized protein LOC127447139 [Myxocyprinus asiaticus]
MSSLITVACGASGQAASALHAMALLQVHQAKALKELHVGSSDTGLMQELCLATEAMTEAMKVTARSLGQAMSTLVVQEHHLWLNLVEMGEADKARFLDAPISQVGLFGDAVEDFAQQFSMVKKQTEASQHILPWHGLRPHTLSACHQGCPPTATTPAPPQPAPVARLRRGALRRKQTPSVSRPAAKNLRKASKHPRDGRPRGEETHFSGAGRQTTPFPGGEPGGESFVAACPEGCSTQKPDKRMILLSPGSHIRCARPSSRLPSTVPF